MRNHDGSLGYPILRQTHRESIRIDPIQSAGLDLSAGPTMLAAETAGSHDLTCFHKEQNCFVQRHR